MTLDVRVVGQAAGSEGQRGVAGNDRATKSRADQFRSIRRRGPAGAEAGSVRRRCAVGGIRGSCGGDDRRRARRSGRRVGRGRARGAAGSGWGHAARGRRTVAERAERDGSGRRCLGDTGAGRGRRLRELCRLVAVVCRLTGRGRESDRRRRGDRRGGHDRRDVRHGSHQRLGVRHRLDRGRLRHGDRRGTATGTGAAVTVDGAAAGTTVAAVDEGAT